MQNPFKFLDSYTKADREIFFGRDKEIEELYSRVFESNLLLVCGLSGTGKSSLIHCGLSSKFNDSDWLPLVIRRGGNILTSVVSAIENASITPVRQSKKIPSPLGRVREGLSSLYLDHFKPIYLIFDQFEELFIFGTKEERDVFIKQVAEVVNSQLQCKFIFVIREEYLAGLIEFERVIPQFFTNRVRIEKMSRHNAVEAIEGPCKVAGIEVEEGFSEQLLEKLSPGKSEVELTYLQVLLDKMFKMAGLPSEVSAKDGGQDGMRAGEIQFTISLMEMVGRISDVLADFLEEQIAKIGDSENALAVLKSFVSMEGTKKVISSDEITEFTRTLGKPLAKEQTENFIRQFVDLRILRDKDDNGKYELRHDSLAGKIYEKITVVEKELIEVRQFVENAYKNFQKRKVLLNESDLKYIALYEGKLYLKEQLNEFLKKSKAETIKKKRRRRRVLIGVVALLFIVLSGFTLWALRERSKAIHAEAALKNRFDIMQLDHFKMLIVNSKLLISKWVFIQSESDNEDKVMLTKLISQDYRIKKNGIKRSVITWNTENKKLLDEIFNDVDNLFTTYRYIMRKLNSIKSYENAEIVFAIRPMVEGGTVDIQFKKIDMKLEKLYIKVLTNR